MITNVTVGDAKCLAIVLGENIDSSCIPLYHKAIMNALTAISMSEDSKDTLTSTSMYFLLQLAEALEEKEEKGGEV